MNRPLQTGKPDRESLSVIVPLYNESAGIAAFWKRLAAVLDAHSIPSEVWFVDDGSADATVDHLREIAASDPRVGVLILSRNFGHQAALTAALDHARGAWVVSLDGDGQHPPELIPELVAQARLGYDIVIARRRSTDAGFFKRTTSRWFYRVLNGLSRTAIEPDAADFRLVSRPAADALAGMRERHRFLRGMVHWIGFRVQTVAFDPEPRLAGHGKYNLRRMLRLAGDALFSFSLAPLRIAILLGSILVILASAELLHTLLLVVGDRRDELVPGWTSLIFAILGIGGVQLITLGIIGQYVGMIFEQVKNRPLYLLRSAPVSPRISLVSGASEGKET